MQKKLNKALLLVFTVTAVTASLRAQQKTSLSELIDRVLTENYQIKIVRNEAKQAANNNSLGNAGFLPTVYTDDTYSRSNNNTHQELYTGTVKDGKNAKSTVLSGYVEADWTIFDGFSMFAKRDKLSLLQQLGIINARYYAEQTIADVSVAYYQLIREINLLGNLRRSCEISRFRYLLEQKRRQVGSGTTLENNLALSDYNSDSLALISQEQTIKSLQIKLNRFTRQDPDLTVFPADTELKATGIAPKDSLLKEAINANKDIKMAMIQELIAEKDVRIQQAARYPQIGLYGKYGYSKQTNDIAVTQLNRTYGRTVGITVRLNLFDGGNLNKAVANEKLSNENTILTRENTSDLVTSEILDDYYEYQSLLRQQSIAGENVRLAEKSQEIAKIQFEKGAINGYDFRQTQTTVINAWNELTEINFSIQSLEIEIDRLTGKLERLL